MDIYSSKGYIIDERFPDCKIHETAVIGDNVTMGKKNIILPYAVIGETGFIRNAEKSEGKVVIGDNNIIGCFTNIMVGKEGSTIIGSDNLIMNHCNIGHNVEISHHVEVGVGTIIAGHAEIQEHVKIKSGCTIRNRIKIIDNAIIGQGSNVVNSLDVEDSLYVGNPAKFVRRNKL